MAIYNEGYKNIPVIRHGIFYRQWHSEKEPDVELLCLPPTAGNAQDYEYLAEYLCNEMSLSVVAFDLPGSGFTRPLNMSVVEASKAISMIIDDFISRNSRKKILLASSGGAIHAFLYLYANRSDGNSIPVIFSEAAVEFNEQTIDFLKAHRPMVRGVYSSLDDVIAAWDVSPFSSIAFDTPDTKKRFINNRIMPNGSGLIYRPYGSASGLKRMPHFDLLDGKEEMTNKSLLLWGKKTNIPLVSRRRLKTIFSNSEEIIFEDGGHPLSLTRAEEMEAIRHFIQATDL